MSPATLEATFVAAVIFIFGLMIGSFLNVVIYRLPADESIVWPGSRCPKCQHALAWWENLPVLSWLMLQGRCFGCKAPISWRYPAIELATAGLFLLIYFQFGLTWQSGFLWVLASLLTVVFWIDMDTMTIFDAVTVPGVVLGLIYSAVITQQFWYALAGALMGVAVLLLIDNLTLLAIKQHGIGDGDLILIAMLGAWLGLTQLGLALGLAFVSGAVLGLAVMFFQWLKQRRWEPFAIAAAVAVPLFAGTAWLFGSVTDGGVAAIGTGMLAIFAGFSAMVGASAGLFFMRLTRDEDYVYMPFGPSLVLGALGSLFWGVPLAEAYFGRGLF